MDVFCGIDCAEDHHDIALAGRDGKLLARRRISDDAAGLAALLELLGEHGDGPEDPVPVVDRDPARGAVPSGGYRRPTTRTTTSATPSSTMPDAAMIQSVHWLKQVNAIGSEPDADCQRYTDRRR